MTTGRREGAGLAVRALTRRFGPVVALNRVDLEVPAGTVHGLIGPNGAGKTSLMAVLLGLVRADSGEARLDGVPLGAAARRVPGGVAGSVDQPRFYGYLTARRNLEVLARLDGIGGLPVTQALELVGLIGQADTKAARLSMGMRQRLAIAASLLRRPGLLVLDEPTSGLDPTGANDLLRLVRGLADDGRSVLLSSHDLVMVSDVCDDVTVMARGRVVRSAAVETLVAEAPAPTYRLRTSDDAAALSLLDDTRDLLHERGTASSGLLVTADQPSLDEAVKALVTQGIAIRELVSHRAPLRVLYDELTADAERAAAPRSSPEPNPEPSAGATAEPGVDGTKATEDAA